MEDHVTKASLIVGSISFALLLAASATPVAAAQKKVALCHVPPENPQAPHTIIVAEAATASHLKHGDQLGECPGGCSGSCDDGNACTTDTCGANGQCQHAPVSCNDGNVCTTDACDPSSGCLTLPANGTSCDDGNACTGGDTCANKVCQGVPVAGCCTQAADCEDGDACTMDVCSGHSCQNPPLDCSAGDKCVAGVCDPLNGGCVTTPVNCDDANICTDDLCDSGVGCFSIPTTHPPQAVEQSCADAADNDCDGSIDGADPDCVPDTTIVAPPVMSCPTVQLQLATNTPGSSFESALDGAAFQATGSVLTLESLAPGPHTLAVRAVSSAGTPDPTPFVLTWSVYVTDPVFTILSPTEGQTVPSSGVITFSLTPVGIQLLVFSLAIDSAPPVAVSMTGPTPYFGLSAGPHMFTYFIQDQCMAGFHVTRTVVVQ